MESGFWHQRWQHNEIGFHKETPNDYLIAHWQELGLPADSYVFVPLCGKSKDLLWLTAQGHQVLGVELSQIAVEAFFDDAKIKPHISKHGDLLLFKSPTITIFCGDLFALKAKDLSRVKAVYDRGSLVALPKKMRQDYMTHMREILPESVSGLLVTMEYDQSLFKGPPFSVTAKEISLLCESFDEVSELAHDDTSFRDTTVRMRIWHYVRR